MKVASRLPPTTQLRPNTSTAPCLVKILAAARAAAAESGPNVPHAQVLADLVVDEARTSPIP